MAVDVTVLRVFTNTHGEFGNPLGVIDAATVDPADRQHIATELGYSETVFVDLPDRAQQAHMPESLPRRPNCRSPATRRSGPPGGSRNAVRRSARCKSRPAWCRSST